MTHLKLLASIALLCVGSGHLMAESGRYRVTWRDDPSTTISIIWEQLSGSNARVHYDVVDHGTDVGAYARTASPVVSGIVHGMDTRVVRLGGLTPDTAYYFVVADSGGTSARMWFRTAPDGPQPFSLVAGGDSRNNRTPRRRANTLVGKLRPLAVLFGGDMTDKNTDAEWRDWFDDWQLTMSDDGRVYPVIAARGNHDRDPGIHQLFDTPNSSNYYALQFGGSLLRSYTLNSEIAAGGSQRDWLAGDLQAHSSTFTVAFYHKPMRPHYSSKSEGQDEYSNWAQLFYDHGVDLVVECDSHIVKRTLPLRPTTEAGHDEGFVADHDKGTVYIGEGCWGAPLRSNDDDKSWTAASGRFNQINWLHVHTDRIEVRTVKVDSSDGAGSVSDSDPFAVPAGVDLWQPASGAVVTIPADGGSGGGGGGGSETNLSRRIAASSDDAEEAVDGSMYLDSSDLELVNDGYQSAGDQTVGLRFRDLQIPAGATITSAAIRFTVDESTTTATSLTIRAEASDTAATFGATSGDISARPLTAAAVAWSPPAWSTVGASDADQRTPDLAALLQELVDRPGWQSGNAVAFVITGSGKRVAESVDGSSAQAPELVVAWEEPTASNQAPSVAFTAPDAGADLIAPADLGVVVAASDADGSIDHVDLFLDGLLVRTEGSAPYEWGTANSGQSDPQLLDLAAGDYVLTAVAVDDAGATTTAEITVSVRSGGAGTSLSRRVAASSDDAEEGVTGSMYLDSSDLELVNDSYQSAGDQTVGIRFRDVQIPAGATITSAAIQFTVDETATTATSLTIRAEANDTAATFGTASGDISARPLTAAAVAWSPPAWSTVGAGGSDQRTPDLAALLQELVDRPGWQSGNAVAFVITGSGKRVAESFDGSSAQAPELVVGWEDGGGSGDETIDVAINFQPAAAPIPAGHLVDSGAPYGDRGNGWTYGWNATTDATRDRNLDADQRYDTLNHLQKSSNPAAVWELALPAGTYDVRIVCSDPGYTDQVNHLMVEGQRVADPDGQDHVDEYLLQVTIEDGRLTIGTDADASNAKIAFIEVMEPLAGGG